MTPVQACLLAAILLGLLSVPCLVVGAGRIKQQIRGGGAAVLLGRNLMLSAVALLALGWALGWLHG